jgi:hypothetical protein
MQFNSGLQRITTKIMQTTMSFVTGITASAAGVIAASTQCGASAQGWAQRGRFRLRTECFLKAEENL